MSSLSCGTLEHVTDLPHSCRTVKNGIALSVRAEEDTLVIQCGDPVYLPTWHPENIQSFSITLGCTNDIFFLESME